MVRVPLSTFVVGHDASQLDITDVEFEAFNLDSTSRVHLTVVRHGTVNNRHQTGDVQDRLVAFVDHATSSHADVRGVPRTLVRHFRQESCRTVDDTVARRERTRVFHLHASQGHCARDRHVAEVRQLREFTAFDFRHGEVAVDRQVTSIRQIGIDHRHTRRRDGTERFFINLYVADRPAECNDLACLPFAGVRHRTHCLEVTNVSCDVLVSDTSSVVQRTRVNDISMNIQQLTVDRHLAVVNHCTANQSRVVRIPLCTLVVGHDAGQLEVTDVKFEAFDLDSTRRIQVTVVDNRSVSNEVVFGIVRASNRHQAFNRQVLVIDQRTAQHTEVRGVPRTLVDQFASNRTRTIDRAIARRQLAPVRHLDTSQRHSTINRQRCIRLISRTVHQLAHRRFRIDVNHHQVTVDVHDVLVGDIGVNREETVSRQVLVVGDGTGNCNHVACRPGIVVHHRTAHLRVAEFNVLIEVETGDINTKLFCQLFDTVLDFARQLNAGNRRQLTVVYNRAVNSQHGVDRCVSVVFKTRADNTHHVSVKQLVVRDLAFAGCSDPVSRQVARVRDRRTVSKELVSIQLIGVIDHTTNDQCVVDIPIARVGCRTANLSVTDFNLVQRFR